MEQWLEIRYNPELSDSENHERVLKQIEAFEASGKKVVSSEPLEQVFVKVVGCRLCLESEE